MSVSTRNRTAPRKPTAGARTPEGPLTAIRRYCLYSCMGGESVYVRAGLVSGCPSACCYLWPYRFGMMPDRALRQGLDVDPSKHPETRTWRTGPRHRLKVGGRWVLPVQVIHWHCLECVETVYDLDKCGGQECPLLAFRFGVSPYLSKARKANFEALSEEEKEARRQRIAEASKPYQFTPETAAKRGEIVAPAEFVGSKDEE